MTTEQMLRPEERVLGLLQSYPGQSLPTAKIAKETQIPRETLKGLLGQMAKNGQGHVQRVGQDGYRYSLASIPKQGESFTGQVVATSFADGAIVRDQTGASWRITPV